MDRIPQADTGVIAMLGFHFGPVKDGPVLPLGPGAGSDTTMGVIQSAQCLKALSVSANILSCSPIREGLRKPPPQPLENIMIANCDSRSLYEVRSTCGQGRSVVCLLTCCAATVDGITYIPRALIPEREVRVPFLSKKSHDYLAHHMMVVSFEEGVAVLQHGKLYGPLLTDDNWRPGEQENLISFFNRAAGKWILQMSDYGELIVLIPRETDGIKSLLEEAASAKFKELSNTLEPHGSAHSSKLSYVTEGTGFTIHAVPNSEGHTQADIALNRTVYRMLHYMCFRDLMGSRLTYGFGGSSRDFIKQVLVWGNKPFVELPTHMQHFSNFSMSIVPKLDIYNNTAAFDAFLFGGWNNMDMSVVGIHNFLIAGRTPDCKNHWLDVIDGLNNMETLMCRIAGGHWRGTFSRPASDLAIDHRFHQIEPWVVHVVAHKAVGNVLSIAMSSDSAFGYVNETTLAEKASSSLVTGFSDAVVAHERSIFNTTTAGLIVWPSTCVAGSTAPPYIEHVRPGPTIGGNANPKRVARPDDSGEGVPSKRSQKEEPYCFANLIATFNLVLRKPGPNPPNCDDAGSVKGCRFGLHCNPSKLPSLDKIISVVGTNKRPLAVQIVKLLEEVKNK
jgi:hypothetical protein